MNVTVNTQEFVQALKIAREALTDKIPGGFDAIRLEACKTKDGSRILAVTGMNSHSNLTVKVNVEADADFVGSVEPTRLIEGISAFIEDETHLSVEDNTMMIRNGDWAIKTPLKRDGIPNRRRRITGDKKQHAFKADVLAKYIKDTAHSLLLRDITNASCYYIESVNGELRVTATNGTSLAMRGPRGQAEDGFVIPGYLIRRASDFIEGDAVLIHDGDRFEILNNNKLFISGDLPSRKFYSVSQLVSAAKKDSVEVKIDKRKLETVLRAVGAFSGSAKFTYEGNTLKVSATDSISQAELAIPTLGDGRGRVVYFRASVQKMRDAIRSLPDEITMTCTNTFSPILFEGEGYAEIVMPIVSQIA